MKHIDGRWLRWATTDAEPLRATVGSGGAVRSSAGEIRRPATLSKDDLVRRIGSTAFAFRGYDVANLGRSRELLDHGVYGPIVQRTLGRFSEICSEALHESIDLVDYVHAEAATSLDNFPQDVATIVAMELAQLEILENVFGVPTHNARLTFGYSIGELSALIFGGCMTLEHLLPVPLSLCRDCAKLAHDTTLGVLFTRGGPLHAHDVERLCTAVSGEGKGLIGPSAYLSPNTALLLGQGKTLDRIEALMGDFIPEKVMLRRNPNQWPPLHSPLVWECSIPNRTATSLYHIEEAPRVPSPPVLSCVTGDVSYDEINTRDILVRWTDHPQRLWDVIDETLTAGVDVVLHVGPAPNLIVATFARLENNVSRQLGHRNRYLSMLGRGLASGLNRHAWLTRLLPSKAALLRLPYIVHLILEDWLLEQPVSPVTAVAVPETVEEHTHDESEQPASAAPVDPVVS
jgi:[acyl-carrier-protein] S-malonyltransferase